MMQASHSVHVYTSCRYSIGYRGTSLMRNSAALEDPTVGLCPEPYVGPRGGAFSYERGTPVTHVSHDGAGATGDRASLSTPASGTAPLLFGDMKERFVIEPMTSDRKLKASSEGSK